MTVSGALRSTDVLDDFELPEALQATAPPELRGIRRDGVRLMVTAAEHLRHRSFADLGDELAPGDLLVVNDSATRAAAVDLEDSRMVHFSSDLPGGLRIVEIRRSGEVRSKPDLGLEPGAIGLPDGARLELLAPFPVNSPTRRLWVAHLDGDFHRLLRLHGRAITYSHPPGAYPLDAYQTVFATIPGSAEMPSAGRPFSPELVTTLVSKGVSFATLTLHTGVSSLETGEPPYPERYRVSRRTAEVVNHTRETGGRVVAVGTTVVRALETVTDSGGRAHSGSGWTDLVIGAETPISAVDAMITGWHEPNSTHLDILVALAGRAAVAHSYEIALRERYLWHEFGDSHLLVRAS